MQKDLELIENFFQSDGNYKCSDCPNYPGHNKRCDEVKRTVESNSPICWHFGKPDDFNILAYD